MTLLRCNVVERRSLSANAIHRTLMVGLRSTFRLGTASSRAAVPERSLPCASRGDSVKKAVTGWASFHQHGVGDRPQSRKVPAAMQKTSTARSGLLATHFVFGLAIATAALLPRETLAQAAPAPSSESLPTVRLELTTQPGVLL